MLPPNNNPQPSQYKNPFAPTPQTSQNAVSNHQQWRLIALLVVASVLILAAVLFINRGRQGGFLEKPFERLEPGVLWREVKLPGGDGERTLWVYVPDDSKPEKRPCIFIAPPGTAGIHGSKLSQGNRVEHLPWVHAGYIVVAYSLDGDIPENAQKWQVVRGIRAFEKAHAGMDNEKAAVEYALKHIANVNPDKLYAVGFDSGGQTALLSAENDRRIAAVVAFAPICDIIQTSDNDVVESISKDISDFPDFIRECKPATKASSLKCPVYLFHSEEDTEQDTEEITGFAKTLHLTNNSVTVCLNPAGDHYKSMINTGIPQAIQWLKNGMPVNFAIEPPGNDTSPQQYYYSDRSSGNQHTDTTVGTPPSVEYRPNYDTGRPNGAPSYPYAPRPYTFWRRSRNPFDIPGYPVAPRPYIPQNPNVPIYRPDAAPGNSPYPSYRQLPTPPTNAQPEAPVYRPQPAYNPQPTNVSPQYQPNPSGNGYGNNADTTPDQSNNGQQPGNVDSGQQQPDQPQ